MIDAAATGTSTIPMYRVRQAAATHTVRSAKEVRLARMISDSTARSDPSAKSAKSGSVHAMTHTEKSGTESKTEKMKRGARGSRLPPRIVTQIPERTTQAPANRAPAYRATSTGSSPVSRCPAARTIGYSGGNATYGAPSARRNPWPFAICLALDTYPTESGERPTPNFDVAIKTKATSARAAAMVIAASGEKVFLSTLIEKGG
ncbi:MAG TPA: hypothetical protein VER38_06055 [Candidatus Eisenbacteria bacterium]|nr:hypothetical protein [Candidatus Eisenbacteria bacterium]